MSSGLFKNHVTYKLFPYKSYICIYIYKQDLALNKSRVDMPLNQITQTYKEKLKYTVLTIK